MTAEGALSQQITAPSPPAGIPQSFWCTIKLPSRSSVSEEGQRWRYHPVHESTWGAACQAEKLQLLREWYFRSGCTKNVQRGTIPLPTQRCEDSGYADPKLHWSFHSHIALQTSHLFSAYSPPSSLHQQFTLLGFLSATEDLGFSLFFLRWISFISPYWVLCYFVPIFPISLGLLGFFFSPLWCSQLFPV